MTRKDVHVSIQGSIQDEAGFELELLQFAAQSVPMIKPHRTGHGCGALRLPSWREHPHCRRLSPAAVAGAKRLRRLAQSRVPAHIPVLESPTSTMLVELYDALKEAGASEQKARAAAENLVVGQDRLERIEQQTGQLPSIQDQIDRAREDIVRLDKDSRSSGRRSIS
jgi:hypothetical protein